jgi:hypothetical protein
MELEAMILRSTRAGSVLKNVLHSRMCENGKNCPVYANCWSLKKLLKHCVQCRLSVTEDAHGCKVAGCKN